jgi:hypothetical protein
MQEKAEDTKHETEQLREEVNQIKGQAEDATVDCTHWKDKAGEIQRVIRRIRAKEHRGPKAIYKAVRSALNKFAYTGCFKPLPIPDYRIEGRVFELINELVFTWRIPISMVEGIVYSVAQATVDVCFGGDVEDVDIEMGEHYEFDEREYMSGGSVVDKEAGPSNTENAEPSPPPLPYLPPLSEEPNPEDNA